MAFIYWLCCLPPSPNQGQPRLSCDFAAQYSAYGFPCQRLNSTPYDAKPMTRGLGGVLTLPSRGLAPPIFYRFISAHWVSSQNLNVGV